jgi:CDP-6-deoxy-D-xylo-4-hexulose-3-dehydrase
MGDLCREFEEKFSEYLGGRHCVFVNSGSSANLLALFALTHPDTANLIEPGSEVIVPAVCWATTVWPIVQAGAIPVFVDVDPDTLQMDVHKLREAINTRTAAVMPVHVMGGMPNMNALLDICGAHNLTLIEDTCEALGSRFDGHLAGTAGEISTFSFYFSHHMTTIEGGMFTTSDPKIADIARSLRSHGWIRGTQLIGDIDIDPRYTFVMPGFNLRPTDINAALGLQQLDRLDTINDSRNWAANQIMKRVGKVPFHFMHLEGYVDPAWFGLPMICESGIVRDRMIAHLEHVGIETRPIIAGNFVRQPAMKWVEHHAPRALPGADIVHDRGLYIGAHPGMSKEQCVQVAADLVIAATNPLDLKP